MTAPSTTKSYSQQRRGRRKPPSPNSILDRVALEKYLEEHPQLHLTSTTTATKSKYAQRIVKPQHIDALYQDLHRQHYPDLPTFVKNHYQNNQRVGIQLNNPGNVSIDKDLATSSHVTTTEKPLPLKNAITNRKNRNRLQLPRPFLDFLASPDCPFVTLTSKIQQETTSKDGTTTKLIIELHDGQWIESVLMRYQSVDGSRASLCISSQCGCAMGCTFCATGTMGLSGNLTCGEILEQIVHADHILARDWKRQQQQLQNEEEENDNPSSDTMSSTDVSKNFGFVRNVVFMGMGEPLDNYTNVVNACRALVDIKRWNLRHGRVTVSTVGIVSKIKQLTNEMPEISLALSLHAPTQELRCQIVPTAKYYPIQDLVDALDNHMMACLRQRMPLQKHQVIQYTKEQRIKESSRRRAMIEYVMLTGPTSSLECAHALGKLCQDRHLIVNLIPYNATNVKDALQCPSRQHMEEFRAIVASYGTFCTIRKTMGADIASACGQLITKEQTKDGQEPTTDKVMDIEDIVVRTTENGATNQTLARRQKGASSENQSSTVEENGRRRSSVSFAPEEDFASGKSLEDTLEALVRPLSIATAVAASCFIGVTALYLRQNKRS